MAEPPPARPRSRRLAADDLRLWHHVTRDVARLRRAPPSPAASLTPEPLPSEPPPSEQAGRAPAPRPHRLPELRPGTIADLDRATAERLRRGALAIDGRLDLHGLTQDEAHAALTRFLAGSAARGRRCVLVITGKGLGDGEAGGRPAKHGARGVLRQAVPRWLNEPVNRGHLLAVMPAQPKHGGAGALYVLLKRKRA